MMRCGGSVFLAVDFSFHLLSLDEKCWRRDLPRPVAEDK